MFLLSVMCSAPGAVWGDFGDWVGGFCFVCFAFLPAGSGSASLKPSPAEGQREARQEATSEALFVVVAGWGQTTTREQKGSSQPQQL